MPDDCAIYRAVIATFQPGSGNAGDAGSIEPLTVQYFEQAAIENPECVQFFPTERYGLGCEFAQSLPVVDTYLVAQRPYDSDTSLTIWRRCFYEVPNSGGTINVGHDYWASVSVQPAPPSEDCLCDCGCGCSES